MREHLAGDLFGALTWPLQSHQQARLQLRLCTSDLDLGCAPREIFHLAGDDGGNLRGLLLTGAGIDTDRAAVLGRLSESGNRVAEPALFARFLEEPRRH